MEKSTLQHNVSKQSLLNWNCPTENDIRQTTCSATTSPVGKIPNSEFHESIYRSNTIENNFRCILMRMHKIKIFIQKRVFSKKKKNKMEKYIQLNYSEKKLQMYFTTDWCFTITYIFINTTCHKCYNSTKSNKKKI